MSPDVVMYCKSRHMLRSPIPSFPLEPPKMLVKVREFRFAKLDYQTKTLRKGKHTRK